MNGYVTKDSGERREFGTGSVRDVNTGKPRFDLLPIPALKRWAGLMARGAEKYGERNWELGQSMARFEESALRHLYQYLDGDRVEDHLAAVLFNVGGLMHHEAEIAAGRLPARLDDRHSSELARADEETALQAKDDADTELLRILATDGKIAAIKARRTATGEGLKEAKDYVDGLARPAPSRPTPGAVVRINGSAPGLPETAALVGYEALVARVFTEGEVSVYLARAPWVDYSGARMAHGGYAVDAYLDGGVYWCAEDLEVLR